MELFKLLGTIAIENSEAIDALDDTTDKASKSEGKMVSAFKKIGGAVATFFAVDKIVDFGKACVDAAVTISAETAAFGQIMGDYSDKAQAKIKEVADTTGIVEGRLTGYMTSMTAKFQGLGYDIDDATTLAKDGLTIAADAAAFWDKSMEDSMSALNSFVNGNYEGGEAIGLFANETTLASWAAENLGYEWKELSEKEKQFTRLEFAKAMQQASGVTGQAANESDAYANVLGNVTRIWQEFKVTVGEPVLNNIVLPAMIKLQEILPVIGENVKNVIQWFQEHETIVTVLAVAVGTLVTAITAYNIAINAVTIATQIATAASTAFGAVMAFITSPITLVVLAIGALIAIGVALYQNWDVIVEKAKELWSNIQKKFNQIKNSVINAVSEAKEKALAAFRNLQSGAIEIFDKIKNGISDRINAARDKVKAAIEKIRSFFNFDWKLPDLKLPHFTISGSFSLNPLSVPSFGIEWYKKAMDNPMIMEQPTAFGINSLGQIMAGGEAGSEVVSGTDTLMNLIASAVAAQNGALVAVLYRILDAIIAMDENMGGNLREALDGAALELNNREFARLVKAVN